jgi:hypothetical protein
MSLDAKMISQAELVSALTDNSLISVSEGEGQPQKNISFPNLVAEIQGEDSKIATASTMEYVRGLDANGNPIMINKSDLASVVAGLMGYSKTEIVYISDYNPDIDNIIYNCRGFVNNGYSGNPISEDTGWAFFECKRFPDGRCMQILTGWFQPNIRFIRIYQNARWTSWKSL